MKQSYLTENIKPILALVIVVFGFGYFYMCSLRDIKPDPQILIAMVAAVSAATGYYFGSSSGSAKKDDTIQGSIGSATVQVDNADTVNANTK